MQREARDGSIQLQCNCFRGYVDSVVKAHRDPCDTVTCVLCERASVCGAQSASVVAVMLLYNFLVA